ncbi:MAG TPA: DNA ligase D [Gemmatimonadaceae bacterium]|nr:DNA ligase D [Gemmatimonadaceae bacterium]
MAEPSSSKKNEPESSAADNLAAYRAKRSTDRTPEPFGGEVATAPGNLFVVHKHAARQLHFDLRLEMDGVLRSWAVPKGPSYDMNDKRLAVKVEDHPLEYGDFEGVIPAGNYGAGGVIVWDRGEWVPLEDWREGLEKGKLLFELKGYKLHGKWTLVKIKKGDKDWLLIKERDQYVASPGDVFNEESVLSGLTVEEIKAGDSPASQLRKILAAEEKAIRVRVDPYKVEAMHCETQDEAFTRDDWLFELKLDGYRLIASKSKGEALLLTRNGNDYTGVFPEIAKAVKALPCEECIIDGEVVVLDDKGVPSFSRLQKRGRLSSSLEIGRAAVEYPATFYTFDLIAYEDFDVRPLPLTRRKELLKDLVPALGAVRYLDHIEREGEAFLEQVIAMGLEGIVAKKATAKYRAGRGGDWIKIKAEKSADFVIVGFTKPNGSRAHLGALQLADWVNGTLVYAGRVGTGFTESLLKELHGMLEPIVRKDPLCAGPVFGPGSEPLPSEQIPETKTTVWTDAVHVCEVRFREVTPDGLLRHASFLRLRTDKRAHECERQGWTAPEVGSGQGEAVEDIAPPVPGGDLPSGRVVRERVHVDATAVHEPPPPPAKAPVEKKIAFSNLSKVFWKAEKYTKGDLIEYYRAVSKWLLPYLVNRPVVLTRYPDGIDGKSFYQKDAPVFAPEWIRTTPVWSEDTQREIKFFVCDDEESLLYLANMGSIPIHIWASRCGTLELPDWCVIDLDPKDAPFSDVIRCAQVLHRICDSVSLPNYVKTTGKTGLHIMLPLGRQCTYEQSRMLGELLARLVLKECGDIATITRHVTKRGDKVYLDYLQNRHGQTIVAPYSVRPLPGATVSMPLVWDEVNSSLDPKNYTIKNAIDRLEKMGTDPVRAVVDEKPNLARILEKLAELWSQQSPKTT